MILCLENVLAISRFTNELKSHDEVGRLHPIGHTLLFPGQSGGKSLFQMIELMIKSFALRNLIVQVMGH